jgi:hypothetical protein
MDIRRMRESSNRLHIVVADVVIILMARSSRLGGDFSHESIESIYLIALD